MIEFVEAQLWHGMTILDDLRGQERKTLEKLRIDAPRLLSKALLNEYPTMTCLVDDRPAAIFGGHSETVLGEVRLWMLTTPLIEAHSIPLLRHSRAFVRWMRENYGPIVGMVDCDFEKSRRWLEWIGFRKVSDGDYIVMRYS